MNKPKTITVMQFAMNLGTTIIGVGLLAFPRITAQHAGTGAPLATLLGVLLMLGCALMLSYLGHQYPNMTLFEYSDKLLGRWLGRIVTLALVLYFLELEAMAAREFGEVVVTSVLQRTPLEITILIMLVLAATAARNDVTVFSRILTFYMPFVYIPVLVLIALTLRSARLTNILPIISFGYQTNVSNYVYAILFVACLFQNYMITGLLTPYMYQTNKAWKGALIGVVAAGAVYLILDVATLAVFGTEEMKNLIWPTLELAKTAAIPLFFLERLDPVFLAVWVTAVFTAIFASYYFSIQGLVHLFNFQDHRAFTSLLVPVVFLAAMQPSNIVDVYRMVQWVGLSGLVLTVGIPALLFALHFGTGALKRKQVKRA
jgi:spore germination protein